MIESNPILSALQNDGLILDFLGHSCEDTRVLASFATEFIMSALTSFLLLDTRAKSNSPKAIQQLARMTPFRHV